MKIKKRLDVLLVERLYAETRSKAQAIIMFMSMVKKLTNPELHLKKPWRLKFVVQSVLM